MRASGRASERSRRSNPSLRVRNERRHGSESLPTSTRADFEAAFGHDFARVRVHHDHAAATAARMFGAQAFTVGQDIVFAEGRYAPDSAVGRHLLAHELTHVVQNDAVEAAGSDARRLVSSPNDPAEHQAEQAAERVGAGESPGVLSAGGDGAMVQRMVDPFGITLLTDAALSAAGLDVGAMAAADAAAAEALVGGWGGPAAFLEAAGTGLGLGGAEAAATTAVAAGGGAAAELGTASTLIGSGALEAVGLDVGMMAAADTAAAEGLIAAWGGPAAFAEAAGLGAAGEAAAVGGGALAAEGAAGAAGVGAAGLGAGSILPLTLAAAGGVAAGIGLDKLSNWVGQEITGDTKGDYSISGAIGKGLYGLDESLTSLWADPSQPAYTQTLGWKLADWLG